MAVSNLIVKQDYICNGSIDTFAIPFSFLKIQQITVTLFDQTTGVGTPWTMGGEYELDPPYDPMDPNLVYLNIVADTPPPTGNILRVERVTALVQDGSYINNSKLLMVELEKSFDKLLYMIQELDGRLDAVPILHELDQGAISVQLPPAAPNMVLTVNEDGDALVWKTIAEIASEAGTGLPAGGDVGDALIKTGPALEDVAWETFAYDGIAQLTGQQFTSTSLRDTLDKIIRITYTPPLVTLSSVQMALREKGTTVSSVDLVAAITKRSDPIAAVRFYRGVTLINTQTSGGGIPAGGNSSYTDANSFTDTRAYTVQVDDDGTSGGPTTVSHSITFPFVYPYYYGVGAAGLGAGVSALTKDVIQSNNNLTRSFSVNGTQKMYFAYPTSYGALTSILDVNNFEVLPDWTLSTQNITGLDGNAVSYRIYEFNNFATAGTYQYTFKR